VDHIRRAVYMIRVPCRISRGTMHRACSTRWGTLHGYATTSMEDAMRAELRANVREPGNRAAVYALLDKVRSQSYDLSSVLVGGEGAITDPFRMVEREVEAMNAGIMDLVSNKHPLLNVMARYYFAVCCWGSMRVLLWVIDVRFCFEMLFLRR
jgi:hypothetical protein